MQAVFEILEEDQYCGSKSKLLCHFLKRKAQSIRYFFFDQDGRYTEFDITMFSNFGDNHRSLNITFSLVGDGKLGS
jgi:hypothetical protein